MATLSYLTDVIGPRLTGSPNLKRANEWTRDKLAAWGLVNARLEGWGPFGRGWSLNRFSAQVVAPQCIPLIGFPKAWSPGLDGKLEARVVYFDAKSEAEFVKFKGKLKGAIVLTGRVAGTRRPVGAAREAKDRFRAPGAGQRSRGKHPRLRPPHGPGPGERARNQRRIRCACGIAAPPVRPTDPRSRRGGDGFRLTPEQLARMELDRKKLMFLSEEGAAPAV